METPPPQAQTCLGMTKLAERALKMGKNDEAAQLFVHALEIGTTSHMLLHSIYGQLGNTYYQLKDFENAIQFHNHDKTIAVMDQNEIAEAQSCVNLAACWCAVDDYAKAIAESEKALGISRNINQLMVIFSLNSLGTSLTKYGHFLISQAEKDDDLWEYTPEHLKDRDLDNKENAGGYESTLRRTFEVYTEMVKVAEAKEIKDFIVKSHEGLANCLYSLGQWEKAYEVYEHLLDQFKKIACSGAKIRVTLSNMGSCSFLLKNYDKAISHYTEAFNLARELQRPEEIGDCNYNLGYAFKANNKLEPAIKNFYLAFRVYCDCGSLPGQVKTSAILSLLCGNRNKEGSLQIALYFMLTKYMVLNKMQNPKKAEIQMDQMKVFVRENPTLINESGKIHIIQPPEFATHIWNGTCPIVPSIADVLTPNIEERLLSFQAPKRNSYNNHEDFLDYIATSQARRMDDQRAVLPGLKKSDIDNSKSDGKTKEANPIKFDENIYEIVIRSQSHRLNDQRTELGGRKATMPEQDIHNLVLRMQAGRLEDQRCELASSKNDSEPVSNEN
uniref:TPR_REGION domain-containing protein n=1 Tax=Rhabditophanes sp. KR3021 TaxID=114890 RepID=A0AC35TPF0_9BILA